MSNTGFIVTVAVFVALTTGLMGCGGGGGGGGGVNPAALVATWQVYQATDDGATVAPADALDWDAATTRQTIEFLADGTCVDRLYDAGGLTGTENGTWAVAAGVLTVTIGGEVAAVTYAVAGNLLTTTADDAGAVTVLRWAKVVALAEHDAAMVRAWLVESVEVSGVDTPLADFFDFDPGSDAMAMQLLADGTLLIHELAGNDIVDHEEGTWATGGGEIIITVGPDTMRGAYVADNTSATFLDSDGSGVVFELAAYAPAGQQHDAAVVDKWTPTSVMINAVGQDIGDFFEWDPASDRMTVEFFADGAMVVLEYAGADIAWAGIGNWNTAGDVMTVNFDTAEVFDTHTIDQHGRLIVTATVGGDTTVIVFNSA